MSAADRLLPRIVADVGDGFVVRKDGYAFAVWQDDKRLSGFYSNLDRTITRAENIRRAEIDRPGKRACMCCGNPFDSTHRFNRLCPRCNTVKTGAMI